MTDETNVPYSVVDGVVSRNAAHAGADGAADPIPHVGDGERIPVIDSGVGYDAATLETGEAQPRDEYLTAVAPDDDVAMLHLEEPLSGGWSLTEAKHDPAILQDLRPDWPAWLYVDGEAPDYVGIIEAVRAAGATDFAVMDVVAPDVDDDDERRYYGWAVIIRTAE